MSRSGWASSRAPAPSDAGGDEHRVRRGADRDDRADVLEPQALAEHEGVLGADRHDERQAQAETGERGESAEEDTAVTLGASGSKPS